MSLPTPSKKCIELRHRTELLPDGTQITHPPEVLKLSLDAPTSTEDYAEENSACIEKWLKSWRKKMADRERDLMNRLITVYYGLWPENCPERVLYNEVSSLLARVENLSLKRSNLVKRLQSIRGNPESDEEFATVFAELEQLHKPIAQSTCDFVGKYELLENSFTRLCGQHPEVVAYFTDLDKQSDEFRESAWDERTEKINNDSVRESEEKLTKPKARMTIK